MYQGQVSVAACNVVGWLAEIQKENGHRTHPEQLILPGQRVLEAVKASGPLRRRFWTIMIVCFASGNPPPPPGVDGGHDGQKGGRLFFGCLVSIGCIRE